MNFHLNRSYNPASPLEAMRAHGLDPLVPLVPDGNVHQFKTESSKGWYVFHEEFDRCWGAFGNWRTGDQWTWSSRKKSATRATDAEVRVLRQRLNAERQQHDDWRSKEAQHIWHWSRAAPAHHPYLVAKHIEVHGVRWYRGNRVFNELPINNSLVVPIHDDEEELQAIHFITADGGKRNLGPTKGGHYWVDVPRLWHKTLCVAEGFATAASVREATRKHCAVAFGHSGFTHVAKYIRTKFDPKRLIIVADGDDVSINSADAAARACDGLVFVADPGLDFNDMLRKEQAA